MIMLVIDIGGIKFVVVFIDNNLCISQCCELLIFVSKMLDVLCEVLKVLVELLWVEVCQVVIVFIGIIQEGMLLVLNFYNLGGLLYFLLV